MNVASLASAPQVAQVAQPPKTASRAPDHDGDSDDGAVGKPTQSATAPGVGSSVDVDA
jgi:hypothetical protein